MYLSLFKRKILFGTTLVLCAILSFFTVDSGAGVLPPRLLLKFKNAEQVKGLKKIVADAVDGVGYLNDGHDSAKKKKQIAECEKKNKKRKKKLKCDA